MSWVGSQVLLTFGRYDTMRPPVVDALYRQLGVISFFEFGGF